MNWTQHHDVLLCREVLLLNPFQVRKGSAERGNLWKVVAENLNAIPCPKFNVDQRGVREHLGLLEKRYKRKMREEEKSSGISPEPTELDIAIDNILQMVEVSQLEQENEVQNKRDKMESDRLKAENIRKTAMEKAGETQRRTAEEDGGGKKPKRQRRSGNDTIEYLRSKADNDLELRKEELELKKRQQELDEKKFLASVAQQKLMQTQQREVVQKMKQQEKQQQQQVQDLQTMLLQQQQQQS